MMSEDIEVDLESPKSVDLGDPPMFSKDDDDLSVSTHQTDNDSDTGSAAAAAKGATKYRTRRLVLLMIALGTLAGLVSGLVIGVAVGKDESITNASQMNVQVGGDSSLLPSEPAIEPQETPSGNTTVDDEPAAVPPTEEDDRTSNDEERVEDTPQGFFNEVPLDEGEEGDALVDGDDSSTNKDGGGFVIGSGMGTSVSWPELVGFPAEEAKTILEDEDEGYEVIIVPPGGVTTKDYREDRIWLYVNEEGYVSRVPRPGR